MLARLAFGSAIAAREPGDRRRMSDSSLNERSSRCRARSSPRRRDFRDRRHSRPPRPARRAARRGERASRGVRDGARSSFSAISSTAGPDSLGAIDLAIGARRARSAPTRRSR